MFQHQKTRTLAGGLFGMSLIASLAATPTEPPQSQQSIPTAAISPFRFAVISDMPYDETQQTILDRVINPKLDEADFPFILHLGDFKTQTVDCTPKSDSLFKQWITGRRSPVFYTPGDNEWADCDYQALATPVSELHRLQIIRTEFFRHKSDIPDLSVEQQVGQIENQSWLATNGNLNFVFGSLHVIGSRNGRSGIHMDNPETVIRQIDERNNYNTIWIERIFDRAQKENASAVIIAQHGDPSGKGTNDKPCTADPNDLDCDPYSELKDKLAEKARLFTGPVLLIHGDTAPVCMETAFHNTPNLWRFNSTGDGVLTDAAVIAVNPASDTPFTISSLVWGLMPGACEN